MKKMKKINIVENPFVRNEREKFKTYFDKLGEELIALLPENIKCIKFNGNKYSYRKLVGNKNFNTTSFINNRSYESYCLDYSTEDDYIRPFYHASPSYKLENVKDVNELQYKDNIEYTEHNIAIINKLSNELYINIIKNINRVNEDFKNITSITDNKKFEIIFIPPKVLYSSPLYGIEYHGFTGYLSIDYDDPFNHKYKTASLHASYYIRIC